MLELIRKHLLKFALCNLILGIALSWLFLRALHPSPVSLLVAVALDSMVCSDTKTSYGYIGIHYQSGEIVCFDKQHGYLGKIKSGHMRYL
jgi:hypothetical protein